MSRAVLVAGSDARFDARVSRVAGTLAARGHEVTVIGRAAPGVPSDERRADGVRFVRVEVSAPDGLPLPGVLRRALVRRWEGRRRRAGTPTGLAAGGGAAPATASVPRTDGRLRRGLGGIVRIAAVALAVRSQARAARSVAPAADVVFGMGFMGLPVALGLRGHGAVGRGTPVVYDAGDVYVDAGNIARLPASVRRAFAWRERGWARRAALVVTANDGYAEVLGRRFGVDRPLVLLNVPPLADPPAAGERRLRDAAGIGPDAPVVLYHGGLSPERGIEELIEAIDLVPGATAGAGRPVLVLLGYGALEAALRERIVREGRADRVRLLPAVPQDELIGWIAGADVAAMPIQPTTLNHRLTVPNKLFEAMAAGVPVVASDLPGMAPIVREAGCGVLVDPRDPAAVAAALGEVLGASPERRAAWREAGLRAHRETYNWQRQSGRLTDALVKATGLAW